MLFFLCYMVESDVTIKGICALNIHAQNDSFRQLKEGKKQQLSQETERRPEERLSHDTLPQPTAQSGLVILLTSSQ